MQIRVIKPHTSVYPDPIEFEKGDKLTLGRKDTEYSGWIRVITKLGKEGWAPEQYISVISSGEGIGKESYTARELNTKIGEELVALKEINEWYWVVNTMGESGWVPVETTTEG